VGELRLNATSFTVGADYQRRLSELWGLGFIVDFGFGDASRSSLIGVPVFLILSIPWRVTSLQRSSSHARRNGRRH